MGGRGGMRERERERRMSRGEDGKRVNYGDTETVGTSCYPIGSGIDRTVPRTVLGKVQTEIRNWKGLQTGSTHATSPKQPKARGTHQESSRCYTPSLELIILVVVRGGREGAFGIRYRKIVKRLTFPLANEVFAPHVCVIPLLARQVASHPEYIPETAAQGTDERSVHIRFHEHTCEKSY